MSVTCLLRAGYGSTALRVEMDLAACPLPDMRVEWHPLFAGLLVVSVSISSKRVFVQLAEFSDAMERAAAETTGWYRE